MMAVDLSVYEGKGEQEEQETEIVRHTVLVVLALNRSATFLGATFPSPSTPP